MRKPSHGSAVVVVAAYAMYDVRQSTCLAAAFRKQCAPMSRVITICSFSPRPRNTKMDGKSRSAPENKDKDGEHFATQAVGERDCAEWFRCC
jgi:hypothetical protein